MDIKVTDQRGLKPDILRSSMMKNRMLPVLFFLVLTISAPLFGQTAVRLEALLETPALTWAEIESFVLEAAEAEQQAAASSAWLPKDASPGDIARLDGVALFLMRSFNLNGGLFYRIAKSPHHAYRELVYKKVIRGNTDPDMSVSGPDLLLMVNRLLAIKEKS